MVVMVVVMVSQPIFVFKNLHMYNLVSDPPWNSSIIIFLFFTLLRYIW